MFALHFTVSVLFYLVGTSIVSVVSSWLPKVPPSRLTLVEAPKPFERSSTAAVFFAAFKVGISSLFGDVHGHLGLEDVPKVFYRCMERRVFVFVVLLPSSTADVACRRFVYTDEQWRFRTMSRFSIVSFSSRPMRLVTT